MKVGAVAKTYAQALYEAAKDVSLEEETLVELNELDQFLNDNKSFSTAIISESFSYTEKQKLAIEFVRLAGLSKLVARVFELLVSKGRARIFSEMVEGYKNALNNTKGIVLGDVTTVDVLTDSERDDLSKAFSKKIGKKVILEQKTDKSILGGLVVNVQGKRFDGSLKTAILNLKNQLER